MNDPLRKYDRRVAGLRLSLGHRYQKDANF